ncbi:DUF1800 domain-containing protein [Luteimonas sp. 100069]|uniref:DUF1800 domain-containing protein n=1 Tax=Luteimonas sp. 100069 TaxID=2006109 RepID=UPI000F4EF9FB|nr:DUF1800 domain-containing protein [Luteimonas sp. 100069]RPD88610.1 DUF1800 domain-containing protein [Luteimonas sp. 100069]
MNTPRNVDPHVAIAINRFGLGAAAGAALPADPRRWLLRQLDTYEALPPAWAATPGTLQSLRAQAQLQALGGEGNEAAARTAEHKRVRDRIREGHGVDVRARFASALDTSTPFIERLVHFWANHFAVSVEKPAVEALAGAFERDAIRPHVLGRFEDLLVAAERHPAMLLYLDQPQSAGPDSLAARRAARRDGRARGLNENLAREILELHTLGVRGGYDQDDVTELARALTGWSVVTAGAAGQAGAAPTWPDAPGFVFRAVLHEPGSRRVLGRDYPQADEGQALAILHDLATSEATARYLAGKLARHFVSDTPPRALVDRLAGAFLRSGGQLTDVYRALVESPEAWAPAPAKFKTPWDWLLSAMRGTGLAERSALQPDRLLVQLGQPVWRPGSPAGFEDTAAAWAAPDALMRRVEMAQRLARHAAADVDARALGPVLLPGVLSQATADEVARAESPTSALALLLMSPEFMRR